MADLKQIIEHLWQRAGETGKPTGTTLARGLAVKIERGDSCRVSFGRLAAWPSELEIQLCLDHLPVPATAERATARAGTGHQVISYTWSPQPAAPGPTPEQPPLDLDLGPIVHPDNEPNLSLNEQFTRFDAANPHVYRALVSLALPLARRGYKRIGIGMLFEKLRYEYAIQTDGDKFRLNNNLRSRYSRKITAEYPELKDVFEQRTLRTQ